MIEPGTWNNFTYLHKLDIQNNELTEINFETFENLRWFRELWLDHNRISIIGDGAWQHTLHLEKLSLSHNRLKYLNSNTFAVLRGLRYLHLQHNSIYDIENGAFVGLPRLYVLNLRNNGLLTLEWNVFNSTFSPGKSLFTSSDSDVSATSQRCRFRIGHKAIPEQQQN